MEKQRNKLSILLIGLCVVLMLPWLADPLTYLVAFDHCPYLVCDFQAVYMPQARKLYEGFMHGGWNYPPILAILLQPLAFLPRTATLIVWMALQLVGMGVMASLVAPILTGNTLQRVLLSTSLTLLCLPVIHNLKWGQVSLGLALAAILALRLGGRAGALLGLAAAIKVYPTLWLVGLGRDRRAWLAALVTLGIGWGLPFLLLPWEHHRMFLEALVRYQFANHTDAIQNAAALGGQGLEVSFYRWFVDGSLMGGSSHEPLIAAVPVVLGQVLGLVPLGGFWLAWQEERTDYRLAHLLCGLTLALQPAWHHYFSFLPLVWALGLKGARWPLSLGSILLSALPLLLFPIHASIYNFYTQWGGTTVTALLAWASIGPVKATEG